MNMVDAVHAASGTLSAQNTWVGPILVEGNGQNPTFFDISIVGNSFVGTVTTQRKRVSEADSAYRDIKAYASIDDEETGQMSGRWYVRAGIKTSEYTGGNVDVSISI